MKNEEIEKGDKVLVASCHDSLNECGTCALVGSTLIVENTYREGREGLVCALTNGHAWFFSMHQLRLLEKGAKE